MKSLPAHITFRHLRFDPDHLENWEGLLSSDEVRRARDFPRSKRREEFILGRAAARLLLSERLGIDPTSVGLRIADTGAIDVLDSDLHVSIAHSGDHAVAAAGPTMIGVDIESITPRHADLHRFMLHPEEYDLLDQIPLNDESTRILCWTLKEATLKAMRTGLRVSPKKLRIHIDFPAERAVVAVEDGKQWTAHFEEWDGYFVAVAFDQAN